MNISICLRILTTDYIDYILVSPVLVFDSRQSEPCLQLESEGRDGFDLGRRRELENKLGVLQLILLVA